MEKIKKILLSVLLPLFLLSSCQDKMVINNAFVYLVHDSCYNYGVVSGDQWQSVLIGDYSQEVTAHPKSGYVFVRWSDGLLESSRKDLATNNNDRGPVIFYAFFEVENVND